jgi:hypothetical protein
MNDLSVSRLLGIFSDIMDKRESLSSWLKSCVPLMREKTVKNNVAINVLMNKVNN